ncbi:MAG: excinuclease ABC subunit UvrC [Catonella sp.]|nr:excinuclease ABC subunit UvrC [Catonella sp.]MDY6357244.1 excinuclease ABC subunit UvrC [Catonella sp.]
MHNSLDEIIYVGKAKVLKNRVRQYFQNPDRLSPKIQNMVKNIDHFEYIVTDSELEALVLESNLIKEHRPKYNTMLKDDKSYPYIRVTLNEAYPRVLFSRRIHYADGSKYFGPYPAYINEILEMLHKLYQIRSCRRNLPADIGKERPCLNYQIGRCDGPCTGNVSEEDYKKRIEEVCEFLQGDYSKVIDAATKKMNECSEMLEFEDAAIYRDMINHLLRFRDNQKINSNTNEDDRDIIAIAKADDEAVMQVFFVRSGRLIGREHFELEGVAELDHAAIYSDFIKQYYSGTPFVPKELYTSDEPEDMELLTEWLSDRRGGKVTITVPKKGEKARMLELAYENAKMVLTNDSERNKREKARTTGALAELSDLLDIGEIHRVESFDISNISGFENVGSMVVFEDGKPKKNDYRKFRIKGFAGQDDYASMNEVLTRRFEHGIKEKEELKAKGVEDKLGKFSNFPDIILMDGGKGQVNIALEVLDKFGLDIPVAGLVKDDRHRTRGIYYNNIEQPIDTHSEMFKLITRVQDETHRFAIEYHKLLRGKAQVHSILDDIPNVGPKRRVALMRHFKSLEDIKNASIEDLVQVESLDRRSAESIYEFFHKQGIT